MSLPRRSRDRLAELILAALYDAEARRRLARLAATGETRELTTRADPAGKASPDSPTGRELLSEEDWRRYADELRDRARRASDALRDRSLWPADAPLPRALDAAALLFDAGLYFEVHELLEPHWRQTVGGTREALQGLIQIAVGFEHLRNGNASGGRALLNAGWVKALGRRLGDRDLDAFARQTRDCVEALDAAHGELDSARIPRFPAGATAR